MREGEAHRGGEGGGGDVRLMYLLRLYFYKV